MADLLVEQILDDIKATLETITWLRVYRGRVYAHESLPAIVIRQGTDRPLDSDGYTNVSVVDNVFSVIIEAHAKSAEDVESTLNRIRKEVYIKLMANITQGLSAVWNTVPRGADAPESVSGAEKPTAMMRIHFDIYYRHSLTDPSV